MARTSTAQAASLRRYLETHHIEMIPATARHGTPRSQLGFWWGCNVNVFNVVLGGVVVSLGLTFWWALVAIATGTLAGGLLIALHATQGPRLGVPQSIQSRGQFGFYGASFLFPAILLLNVGFIAAQLVIQAQAMTGVTSALSVPGWIVVLAVPAWLIGVFGYRWIHKTIQATAVLVSVSLAVMLIQALAHGHLPASQATLAAPRLGLFMAGVALLVIDMLSFGPFVSDYTRYLPQDTSGTRMFWAIYAGNVLATFFSCMIGAYIAALLPALGPVAAIGRISDRWALVMMTASLIDAGAFNAYTGTFQALAIGNMWHRFRAESVLVRVIPFTAIMAIGTITALLGWQAFVNNLGNFLDVLLVIFIPWSAVNITDYFVVRHGNYDVASFFTARGSYPLFAWRGLLAYAAGLAAEWPFVSQPDYTSPLVARLGGADVSWIVGWIIPAALYLLLARTTKGQTAAPALAESD
jgi:nucleobase:cation symporter-1, NCS1 family